MINLQNIWKFAIFGLILFNVSNASSLRVSSTQGEMGDTVIVSVSLDNEVDYAGLEFTVGFDPSILTLDSVNAAMRAQSQSGSDFAIVAGDSVFFLVFDFDGVNLPIGTGSLFDLHFIISDSASEGIYPIVLSDVVGVDNALAFDAVTVTNGQIQVGCCIDTRGNVDNDPGQVVDIADLTLLIDHLFINFPELACINESNIDADAAGVVDIADLTLLIDHLFINFPVIASCDFVNPPPPAQTPNQLVQVRTEIRNGRTDIYLNSEIELRGVQIVLRGEGDVIPAKRCCDSLNLFSGRDGDVLRIGMVDIDGGNTISKGEHTILGIKGEFEIVSAQVSDLSHNSITPIIGAAENAENLPDSYDLSQNYPNPFNPSTIIEFALPQSSNVKLTIFNLLGQTVSTLIDKRIEAGFHSVTWEGTNATGNHVASGVYFYLLEAGDFVESKKMMLLK